MKVRSSLNLGLFHADKTKEKKGDQMVTALKSKLAALWNDESAQGSTEYILLLAVVVVIAVMFKGKIKEFVGGRLEDLGKGMGEISAQEK